MTTGTEMDISNLPLFSSFRADMCWGIADLRFHRRLFTSRHCV